jgi:uncharacterized damage-inducible protein DinB
MTTITRPEEGEYNPYYSTYIDKVKGNDILMTLEVQLESTTEFIRRFDYDKQDYRYAENKWTPKEVFLHILDAERVFAYRALRVARGDETPLPGFDQDQYVPESNAGSRSLESIAEEYEAVRNASLQLFRYLTSEQLQRRGIANNSPISARALAFIIAGHENHHLEVLRERYLGR